VHATALRGASTDGQASVSASMHGRSEHIGPRTICLCVDDFGLHEGVNDAALRLVGMDRAHAIGCMVGAPGWAHSGQRLRALAANTVDVGLHLDLTEYPLLERSRRALVALIVRSHSRTLVRDPLRAEIAAQFDAFEQVAGRGPAFVDGHQHVHQFPVIRDLILDETDGRYRDSKPWLRSTRTPRPGVAVADATRRDRLKPRTIEFLGARGLERLAQRRGYRQNRHLLGVYGFTGGRQRYERWLAAWLSRCDDADLLMCHPSTPCGEAAPALPARLAEFEVLAAPLFGQMLARERIMLRPMSEILGRAAIEG
jgi:predicted glycoside hydrolase/deacetylase ChbG (UPF0249 family)